MEDHLTAPGPIDALGPIDAPAHGCAAPHRRAGYRSSRLPGVAPRRVDGRAGAGRGPGAEALPASGPYDHVVGAPLSPNHHHRGPASERVGGCRWRQIGAAEGYHGGQAWMNCRKAWGWWLSVWAVGWTWTQKASGWISPGNKNHADASRVAVPWVKETRFRSFAFHFQSFVKVSLCQFLLSIQLPTQMIDWLVRVSTILALFTVCAFLVILMLGPDLGFTIYRLHG